MTHLIIGYEDSGKSEYAENLSMEISNGFQKIYIATMIPYGEEGQQRITKHKKQREGKGFLTMEKADHLESLCDDIKKYPKATCLLECVSNLLGNELYKGSYNPNEMDESRRQAEDNDIMQILHDEIESLIDCCDNLVMVSNDYEIRDDYDNETIRYCNLISKANVMLSALADKVHVIRKGEWSIHENF